MFTADRQWKANSDRVKDSAREWRAAYDSGADLLRHRQDSLRSWTPSKKRTNLSLCTVQRDGLVRLDVYHWIRSGPNAGQGLRVVLDEKDRVKYSVTNSLGEAAIDLEQMFRDDTAKLVLPDCGVAMNKDYRDPCPPDVLRLRRMWSTSMGSVLSSSECVWCQKHGMGVMRCTLCGTSMHRACGERLVGYAGTFCKTFGAFPAPCDIGSLPAWWNSKLCALCLRTQSVA